MNQGDGKGRSKANVVALRAVFIDDDGKAASVAFQSDGVEPFAALAPTITVQGKAGQHNYFQLVAGEALERFILAQENLVAHFGTDPVVKDLARSTGPRKSAAG